MDEIASSKDRLCCYDGTRLRFRGPARTLTDPYIAILGGSETFGKGLALPYPALLERKLGHQVANFGVMHAGVSIFSDEGWLIEKASASRLTILQILGAPNMSNRLYSVHSRRNDRFLGVSPALRELFPEVDFTEINFTGHLMRCLSEQPGPAFNALVQELKWAWVQRMKRLIGMIEGDVILLWISQRELSDISLEAETDPLLVDQTMLDELKDDVQALVQAIPGGASTLSHDKDASFTSPVPDQRHHDLAADALARAIRQLAFGQNLTEWQALA